MIPARPHRVPQLASPPHRPDYVLLAVTISLLAFGLVMVLASSMVTAYRDYGNQFYYLERQGLWAVLGLTAMYIAWQIDYRRLGPYALLILVGCIVALIAVLVPGLGQKVYGAQRWLALGPFHLQPVEFAKLGLSIYMAYWLAAKDRQVSDSAYGFIPFVVIIGLIIGLLLGQPDFGSTVVIGITAVAIFFAAGARPLHLGILGVVGGALFTGLILFFPYRLKRLMAFLDPWKDPTDTSYHVVQVLQALGAGGITGTGLGEGRGKFNYLPFPHTDSIYAVVGEEFGLIGTVAVLLAFLLFACRGLLIAWDAPDAYGRLLATGITCGIVFQALIAIGVTTSSLPFTGITLPFISFGGSSLLITLASTGVLLNVSRHTIASEERFGRARSSQRRRQRGAPLPSAGRGSGTFPLAS